MGIGSFFKKLGKAIKHGFESIGNSIQKTFNGLKDVAKNLMNFTAHIVNGDFGAALKDLEKATDAAVRTAISGATTLTDAAIQSMSDMGFKELADIAKDIEKTIADGITDTVSGFMEAAEKTVTNAVSFAGNIAQGKFGKALEDVVDMTTGALEAGSYLTLAGTAGNFAGNVIANSPLGDSVAGSVLSSVVARKPTGSLVQFAKQTAKDTAINVATDKTADAIEKSPLGDTFVGQAAADKLRDVGDSRGERRDTTRSRPDGRRDGQTPEQKAADRKEAVKDRVNDKASEYKQLAKDKGNEQLTTLKQRPQMDDLLTLETAVEVLDSGDPLGNAKAKAAAKLDELIDVNPLAGIASNLAALRALQASIAPKVELPDFDTRHAPTA